jgi:dihydrofolate reductase
MKKLIVLSFITLDGVMQAPGGPEEDPTGDFSYGGWIVPYVDDFLGNVIVQQLSGPFDLLLGRKTYEIFAAHWPYQNTEIDPIAAAFGRAKKYVVSNTLLRLDWSPSMLIQGDVVEKITKLKTQDGPDLQVYGSGKLIQKLLTHDLVDELWLKIFPITLGKGKRLFAEGTAPSAFALLESKTSPSGVIIATYARAGAVKTGSFAMENPTEAELARRKKMREEHK